MSDTKDKIVANISKSINLPDSFKMALDDVKGMSKMNQILIGGSSGLVTGFVVKKIGKIAGVAIGGTLMVFQVAQHFGYIEINWKKFQKDFDKQKKRTIKAINANTDGEKLDRLVNDTKSFISENISFALSFLGGTLVGISF